MSDVTQHIPLIPMGTAVHGSAWLRNLAKANQHTVRLSVNAKANQHTVRLSVNAFNFSQ